MKTTACLIKNDFRLKFLLIFLKYPIERIFIKGQSIYGSSSQEYSTNLSTSFLQNIFSITSISGLKNLIITKKLISTYSSPFNLIIPPALTMQLIQPKLYTYSNGWQLDIPSY